MKAALLLLLAGCAAVPPPAADRAPYAELLKGATKLKVRSGGLCHRTPAEERTLLMVNDAAEVRAVAGCLRIPPRLINGEVTRCRCCGDPTLEFFKRGDLLVAVALHHGNWIRSDDIGNDEMSPLAAEELCRWLAERGIPEPEEARKRSRPR